MIWITADDVIQIHSRVIQRSGGMDGLRDRASLEAAVSAPMQSFGGQDPYHKWRKPPCFSYGDIRHTLFPHKNRSCISDFEARV